ncbi:hypothetical protein LEP1GSC060_3512 [Leptospira weilii serovar Ranarum str. ICFT]|uniref:Uncharacterized protein n=1 Tax=Leptospira weilii serovar Ranarum str. ICFT TaxID=1218598 RepID=N1WGR0_9LEPT|nr:hypothetical protein LEP1GSC060_3512 [Leptospira weilii serovar Ranarum str. ICFT]
MSLPNRLIFICAGHFGIILKKLIRICIFYNYEIIIFGSWFEIGRRVMIRDPEFGDMVRGR